MQRRQGEVVEEVHVGEVAVAGVGEVGEKGEVAEVGERNGGRKDGNLIRGHQDHEGAVDEVERLREDLGALVWVERNGVQVRKLRPWKPNGSGKEILGERDTFQLRGVLKHRYDPVSADGDNDWANGQCPQQRHLGLEEGHDVDRDNELCLLPSPTMSQGGLKNFRTAGSVVCGNNADGKREVTRAGKPRSQKLQLIWRVDVLDQDRCPESRRRERNLPPLPTDPTEKQRGAGTNDEWESGIVGEEALEYFQDDFGRQRQHWVWRIRLRCNLRLRLGMTEF